MMISLHFRVYACYVPKSYCIQSGSSFLLLAGLGLVVYGAEGCFWDIYYKFTVQ